MISLIKKKGINPQDKSTLYFPQWTRISTINETQLAKRMARGSTFSVGEINGVFADFPQSIIDELLNGNAVSIDGLGTFKLKVSGKSQKEKKCGVLSGGERNRLQLALALKQEGNVLLLDEPTNDIDVNTLRALEEGLEAFAGCAVIISHDRWFLDRICTHILAFEGDGQVFYFEGSYTDYEANKAKRLGLEEPKRIRYRKLMDE